MPDSQAQTWTVTEWDHIDGGVLGALIVCPFCLGDRTCREVSEPYGCSGTGALFQPYHLPNGAQIDLWKHAELFIQIENDNPEPSDA